MTIRTRFSMPLLILALLGLLAFSSTASAAYPIAKDGKIYACFKTKGKGKGTVRVIRNANVRCPRKWRKMAWNATVRPGPQGPAGATGATGGTGEQGLPGTAGNVAVEDLEDKVSELLNRVETLEGTVVALCAQTELLNEQTTALGATLGSLNTVLTPLLIGFSPVSVPAALPSFSCPTS